MHHLEAGDHPKTLFCGSAIPHSQGFTVASRKLWAVKPVRKDGGKVGATRLASFDVLYHLPSHRRVFLLTVMEENRRALLFNVNEPFELTLNEFDELWPLVSNVWVRWDHYQCVNGDSWKIWVCRFMKHNKSSTRKEGVSDNKRRKTMVRDTGLCEAKIKITRLASAQKVCACEMSFYLNC